MFFFLLHPLFTHAQLIKNLIVNPTFKGIDSCCEFGWVPHHIPAWFDYGYLTLTPQKNKSETSIGVLNNYYPNQDQEFVIATLVQPLLKNETYLLTIHLNDRKKKLLLYFFTDTLVTAFMDRDSVWIESQKIDTVVYKSGKPLKIKPASNTGKRLYFAIVDPDINIRFTYPRTIYKAELIPITAKHYYDVATFDWIKGVYKEKRKHYFASPCEETTKGD